MSNESNFRGSAESLCLLVDQIADDCWNAPAVDGWTVRELAGHAVRAILTVETYLLHDEPGSTGIPTAEAYYAAVYPALYDPAMIHSDGVTAGAWIANGVGVVSDALARAVSLIESQAPGRAISIGGMGIPLDEYLRTRTVELVLHTLDLAAATGLRPDLPEAAVADAVALVTSVSERLLHGEVRLIELSTHLSAA